MSTACLGRGCSSAHLRIERALAQPWRPLPRRHGDSTVSPRSRITWTPVRLAAGSTPIGSDGFTGVVRQPKASVAAGAAAASANQSPIPSQDATGSPSSSSSPTEGSAAGPEAAATHAAAPNPAPSAAAAPSAAPSAAAAATSAAQDDGFARAWKPTAGDPPLWWVEKFEARRKEEARRKAEDPAFVTTLERVSDSDAGGKAANPAVQFLLGVLQVIQLFVVLSLLLLLPAGVHDGGLTLARPYTTFAAYLAFFGMGSVARMLRHGALAPRSSDRQVATWGGRLAFAVFVTLVPLLHWVCMYRYAGLELYTNTLSAGTTLYDVVGGLGMLLATSLNFMSSKELGAAYDRVAAPAHLITSGPYRFVQHPIYTSYMLLFFSYGMWLHSVTVAMAMLAVCALYYRVRTALEARVLEEAFGGYYRDYRARTKKYVPFMI